MAANVLNSPEAIRMSVFVVRAFVKMREALISRSELAKSAPGKASTFIGTLPVERVK